MPADVARLLRLVRPLVVARGFDRKNLAWHVIAAPDVARKDRLVVELLKRETEGTAVVYAPTRKAVDGLADVVNRAGIRAAGYHAGVNASERQRLQDAFMSERFRVVVATNALALGSEPAAVFRSS